MVNNFRQSASGCRVISFNKKKLFFISHSEDKRSEWMPQFFFCLYWKLWDEKITICWIRNTSKIDRSTLKSVSQCRAIHWDTKKLPPRIHWRYIETEPKLSFTSELYKNSLFSEWKTKEEEETTQGPDSGTLSRFTFIVYLIIFFPFLPLTVWMLVEVLQVVCV